MRLRGFAEFLNDPEILPKDVMKIAQRLFGFLLSLMIILFMTPFALAQGKGPGVYVAGIKFPAGPPTAPTNTGFWIGGISPVEIHYGDVNGDGKLDVISVSNCGYNPWFLACPPLTGSVIAVYLNNGDGTFQAPILSGLTLPNSIRSMVVGDFNEDGKLDVVVGADAGGGANGSDGTVTVLLGNGDGTFTQSSQYAVNGIFSQASTLAVGDFNKDGKWDVAVGLACYNITVTSCSFGAVEIYLGLGDGTLSAPTTYTTVGNGTVLPVVGDFNGDGKLDVIAVVSGSASLAVLIGNGDGTFSQPANDQVPLPPPNLGVSAVSAIDLNSDGRLDLVYTLVGDYVNVTFGNGDGTFQSPTLITTGLTYQFSGQVNDLNHDGHPDIVVSGYGVQVLLNDGNGSFVQSPVYYGLTGNAGLGLLAIADFNGDGNVDILTGAPGGPEGTLGLLLGNSDGTMQGAGYLNQASLGGSSAIAADVNGDGIPDIIEAGNVSTGSGDQGGILVFLGTGNGQYAPPVAYDSGVSAGRALLAGDFNGDGKIDIAVASLCSDNNCTQGGVSILLGNGDGTFQPSVIYATGAQYAYSIAIGDFNGDGKLDVAVANQFSSVGILLGNGDGTLQPVVVTTAGSQNLSIAAADFNGDGKTDIALDYYDPGAGAGSVQILLSGNNGTLNPGASYPSGGSGNVEGSVAVADVNRDGKLDLVVANQCQVGDSGCSFGSLATLIGNGDGTFVSGPLQTIPDGNLYSLLLADVNGDGILDAVAADLTGVEVFLGKGDGSFITPIVYAGVQSPGQNTSVALADLNIIQPGSDATAQSAIFVNRAGTYLVTKSSANPSAASQAIQLTTTASASYLNGITPTGSISYYDGGTFLGSAALAGGTASFNLSSLSSGVHTVTAFYSGDSNFNAHAGTPLLQVLTGSLQSPQTITFAIPTSSVTFSTSPIALSAAASSGLPVTFTVISGPGTVSGSTLTVNAVGTIVIEADQPGNGSYSAAPPVQQTLTVSQASSVITWINPPAITYGTALTSSQLNATAPIHGNFVYSPAAGAILGAGPQNLSVTFTPTDTNDYASASSSVTLLVNKATPTVTFSGAPASAPYLSTFAVSAVSPATSAPSLTANGSCGIAANKVTITVSTGLCSLNASWAADSNYLAASATQSTTATQAPPTITWATPAAISYGAALSATQLNATATYNGTPLVGSFSYAPAKGTVLGAGARTLSVVFAPKSADYTSITASVVLQVNQANPKITWAKPAAITYGTALSSTQLNASATVSGTFVYSPAIGTVLDAGVQTLSVTFSPTDSVDYAMETKSITLTVARAPTTTSITVTPSSILFGQPVTFTASTSSAIGVIPTGTVTFKQGTTVLATSSLDTTGAATFTTNALSVGNHNVTASFPATTDFGASSSTVTETVGKLPTSTSLSSSADPSTAKSNLTFTATVLVTSGTTTSFTGSPTGSVAFYDGAAKLGASALSSSGVSTFATKSLSSGSHNITAVYAGNSDFATSSSTILAQTVN